MTPLTLPPLSLYVHVPWCVRKCPYCDFNSHAQTGALPEADYIAALLQDLRQDSGYIRERPLHSIFIGGGTPSLFSAASFHTLLTGIARIVPFADDIEITLEANPGTFEQDKFAAYRQAGINRLSIGVQSFDDAHLHQLGRIHGGAEALRAAAIAHQAGFENFNLDLMFGLPGQDSAQACEDLRRALACKPTHLSWYQLTIEPNTEYFRRPPVLPHDDALADMQDAGFALLASHGFERYEISAFSQHGKQARHNLNYWQFGDYLGIGAGAHGKLTLPDARRIIRTRKTRMPGHYLDPAREFTAETRTIPAAELPLEFMMNALRLSAGASQAFYSARTGLPLDAVLPIIRSLQQRGLLRAGDERIQATATGLQLLNDVLVEFL